MGNLNAHAVGRPVFAHADIAAALHGAIRKALVTLRTWHWRARTRRQILTLGDRMLADIGGESGGRVPRGGQALLAGVRSGSDSQEVATEGSRWAVLRARPSRGRYPAAACGNLVLHASHGLMTHTPAASKRARRRYSRILIIAHGVSDNRPCHGQSIVPAQSRFGPCWSVPSPLRRSLVLMGARQTGKSTLAQSEPFLENRLYLTLDDLEVRERARIAAGDLVRSAPAADTGRGAARARSAPRGEACRRRGTVPAATAASSSPAPRTCCSCTASPSRWRAGRPTSTSGP